MKTILNGLDNRASWRKVIVFLIGTVIMGTCIVTQFFGMIKLDANATMDSETFYTSETFYHNLEVQGPEGRHGYVLLHLLDYVFLVFFALLLIFTLYLLIRKAVKNESLRYLALLPLISGVSDLCENLCADISIGVYPGTIPVLGSIAGYFTAVKMYTLYVVFALILVLAVMALVKKIRERAGGPAPDA